MLHFSVLLTLAVIYTLITVTLSQIFHEKKGPIVKGMKIVNWAIWPVLTAVLVVVGSSLNA